MLGVLLSLALAAPADSGLLTVRSNMPGLALYLEGDYLGRAPVENHALRPGSYSLSIASDDSLENIYWRLRTGSVGARLSSLWTLAAINAGTQSVAIRSGMLTEVSVDYGRIANAPTEAKVLTCCGVGSLFALGAAVGFLIRND
jgi:hypothetical protein